MDWRSRRVVFLVHNLDMGGAERQALLLARHLRVEAGAHVEVWALAPGTMLAAACRELSIPTRVLAPAAGVLRGVLGFAAELRRSRAHVVLGYTAAANVLAALAWRLGGVELFVWCQRDPGLGLGGTPGQRLAMALAPLFIANSQHARDLLRARFHVPARKLHVIGNGVAVAAPRADRAAWRRRLGLSAGDFVGCMVANVNPVKDHATLIRAWAEVARRRRGRAVLLLAGRTDQGHEHLVALARDGQIAGQVVFLGAVDDVFGLLAASDVAILSSHRESLPNGVLEPMAVGLPVVATDLPGIREAVGPAGEPWLVPPDDAGALAERILALAADPELARSLGAAHRARVAACFTEERMTSTTRRLLESFLD